jgi:hypothetical protein
MKSDCLKVSWLISIIVLSGILLIHMPDAYCAPPDAAMCVFLEKFHGHTCPGFHIGPRLGLTAKEASC